MIILLKFHLKLLHLHFSQLLCLPQIALLLIHLMNIGEVDINRFYGFGEFVEGKFGVCVEVESPEDCVNLVLGRVLGLPAALAVLLEEHKEGLPV